MEIDVRTQDQVKIIKLRGKLNLGSSLDRTNETIKDLLNAGNSRFLLDLQEVPMIDSSGIGELIANFTTVNRGGGQLKLLNLTEKVQDLLVITKLLTVFDVYDNEADGLSSFK